MPFAVVGPAIPIFMAGDSHTLAYSDMVFESDGNRYITRGKYCNGITAQKFTDPQGNLYPTLLTALESELLVSRNGDRLVANHRTLTGNIVAEGLARERAHVTPILCIFAGDVDMRTVFLPNFKSADFELPGICFQTRSMKPTSQRRYPTTLFAHTACGSWNRSSWACELSRRRALEIFTCIPYRRPQPMIHFSKQYIHFEQKSDCDTKQHTSLTLFSRSLQEKMDAFATSTCGRPQRSTTDLIRYSLWTALI